MFFCYKLGQSLVLLELQCRCDCLSLIHTLKLFGKVLISHHKQQQIFLKSSSPITIQLQDNQDFVPISNITLIPTRFSSQLDKFYKTVLSSSISCLLITKRIKDIIFDVKMVKKYIKPLKRPNVHPKNV